jgi:hypothetical protein
MDTTKAAKDSPVSVTAWDACYNQADGIISLSCTVSANDGEISGVGLMLNNSGGVTLASSYVELSNNCQSATPALNIPPGNLNVGDRVWGVVSGEADGQHYFFEQELTIGNC